MQNRQIQTVIAACWLVGVSAYASPKPPHTSNNGASFDWLMHEQEHHHEFNGAVLVAKGGLLLFQGGYGFANRDWMVRNTADTRFRIASITKSITATAVMRLSASGRLRLTDKVCGYLKGCPSAWADITVDNLLDHTSCIPNYLETWSSDERHRLVASAESIYASVKALPLHCRPGDRALYSNTNYFLLGQIIERASGMPYAQAISELVLKPVGMSNTDLDRAENIVARRATGYVFYKGSTTVPGFVDMSWANAAGQLYSTVGDLWKWQQSLYDHNFLAPQYLDLMATPPIGPDGKPFPFGRGLEDFPQTPTESRFSLGHPGQLDGTMTLIQWFPAERIVVVVLSNGSNADIDAIADGLANIARVHH